MTGGMSLHGGGPLGAVPKVASARLIVEYTDGTTGTIDVPGATAATFDVEIEDNREISIHLPVMVIGHRRETLVIRVADPQPFTVTVPHPPTETT